MGELELLKSMWAHKVKRNTKLIVSEVTYDQGKGHLNNDHWHFQVPYAFRDALDLKYEQRMKIKNHTWYGHKAHCYGSKTAIF